MDDDEGLAYWSGYTPGKVGPGGAMVPLGAEELRAQAARFRRGAVRAQQDGDVERASRMNAADDLERRSAQAG